MDFREMAALEVLRPEDEFRQARELEQLEIQLWERIFAHAPALEHVLRTIEITMENSLPDFRAMRKLLAERPTRSTGTAASTGAHAQGNGSGAHGAHAHTAHGHAH